MRMDLAGERFQVREGPFGVEPRPSRIGPVLVLAPV